MEKNNKVPIAILSCFLIAFVLQGILKISGVFIFEKALDWEIFKIIDSNVFLNIVHSSIITIIIVYCLSFALTSKCYSKKWYHYLLIVVPTIVIVTIRTLILTPMHVEYILDIILYVTIPLIINLTTSKEYILFKKRNLENIVITISVQILLYFCYLGLAYWSSLLNSLIPVIQECPISSVIFLIYFEVYMSLIFLMLTFNTTIKIVNKIVERR